MKFVLKLFLPFIFFTFFDFCSDSTSPNDRPNFDKSLGYFPLQVGNYWETNLSNYSEITDTLTLAGDLFFKEISLVGGDALGERILKVDENNNLIQGFDNDPTVRWTLAKFNAEVGDTFSTIGDNSPNNDYLVTVIEKKDDEISFEYSWKRYPESKRTEKYIKGFGLDRGDRYAIINGKEYKIK